MPSGFEEATNRHASAGWHLRRGRAVWPEIPACAGMTVK